MLEDDREGAQAAKGGDAIKISCRFWTKNAIRVVDGN